MPSVKFGAQTVKIGSARGVKSPVTPAPPNNAEIQIGVTRTTPLLTSRLKIGATWTQDTFATGNTNATAVARAKAYMVDMNLDFLNMHNHQFGAEGPYTNENKRDGVGFTRGGNAATASGWNWSVWDARLQTMKDCKGASTKLIITLLPPGWCMMDGGSYNNGANDPLGHGRSWESINADGERRHTDAHELDMIELARQIAMRHTDVHYISVINEQKGNYIRADGTPGNNNYPQEISSAGMTELDIANYVYQANYQEAMHAAMQQLVTDGYRATAPEVIGPYLVIGGGGHEMLYAKYDDIGFPAPLVTQGAAPAGFFRVGAWSKDPVNAKTKSFLEFWYAQCATNARNGWYALDHKLLDADNETANWANLYAWRWYFFEAFEIGIQEAKEIVGYTSSDKIIMMEDYWRKVQDDVNVPSDDEQGAMAAEMLRIEAVNGVDATLRWAPMQGVDKPNRCNWFTKADTSAGGQPFPAYYSYLHFCNEFRAGAVLYPVVTSNAAKVTAISNATKTLLINHTNAAVTVSINNAPLLTLAAFEVELVTA